MENTPDGNGKEQTVRSLIFPPMLHVMSETNANDCHICVVCASDVLDKFFVQRVLVFRLRFDNFDNSDVLKHKPVLTMFSMTVEIFRSGGVWKFRPGLVGSLSGAKDAAESLVSPACARVQVSNLQFPPFWTFLQLIRAPCLNVCQFGHRLLLHFCFR